MSNGAIPTIMDWQKMWNNIVNYFESNIWNIVMFFAVLFVGIIVVKLVINITRRILNKTNMEKIAVGFIVAIIKFVLYLFLIIILLNIMGIEITGIVTALSAVFLSVGLALQNNIANVANGIIIVSSKMFKKGDYIQVEGVEGSITHINFLYVTLLTPDNKRITLPNSKILNGIVVNFDSNNTRRVNFEFSVAYESDVELVKKVVVDSMLSNGMVLTDPAPFCRLNRMDESSLVFTGRCWCDREDYWTVYFDVTETVFNEFKRHNISVPFNQMEIRQRIDRPKTIVVGNALPKRVEKVRNRRQHFDLENGDLTQFFPHRSKKSKKAVVEKPAANEPKEDTNQEQAHNQDFDADQK